MRKNAIEQRKERQEYVGEFKLYDFNGKDVRDVIKQLQDLQKGKVEALFGSYCSQWDKKAYDNSCKRLKKYHRFVFKVEGYDDQSLNVYGYRYETDNEMEARVARSLKAKEAAKKRQAKQKKEKEAQERKEYERLMKKFGSDS
jgi:hypothetical protein